MVKDYLDELNIRCVYRDRGCEEIVQLQHLDQHEDSCGFTPAVCGNQGCGAILNKRDLIHHESELCEYRKLKCHSCEETAKTLADVEKQTTRMETNQKNMETKLVNLEKNMETQIKNTDTTMKNTAIMEIRLANVETRMENVEMKMVHMKTDLEGKLDAVNNEVKGLRAVLVEAFNEMKDVLVKMDGKKEENARKVSGPSGDRENIIVAGGYGKDSVEMFNRRQRTWSPLGSNFICLQQPSRHSWKFFLHLGNAMDDLHVLLYFHLGKSFPTAC